VNKEKSSEPLNPKETKLDTKRLYVLNLPYKITENEARSIFNKYGTVVSIHFPKDKEGNFKGFAFVSYSDESEAMRAYAELDNKVIFGRFLHIRPAYE